MSSPDYENFDRDAIWNNASKPGVNFISLGCVIVFGSIWPVLFGIFTFQTDVECPNKELLTFTTISFWLLLVILILSVIIVMIQSIRFDGRELAVINCFMTTIVLVISLFIFIRGFIVILSATHEVDCEALYYLVLLYVILCFIAFPLGICAIICLFCLLKNPI